MRSLKALQQRAIYSISRYHQSSALLHNLEHSNLTDRAREYHENGYIVIKQLYKPDDIQMIKQEMIEICRGNRGDIEGVKVDKLSTDLEILKKYLCFFTDITVY